MNGFIRKIDFFLPENILTNDQLKDEFPDWNIEKYEKKIGIKQRHVAGPAETSLDLGRRACEKVLNGYDRTRIDTLIFCTQSPDYFLPTTACILQHQLGLSIDTAAFDVNLGCSGYIYGLAIAKGFLAAGMARHILLVTAETYSKFICPKDRSNRLIFGDAGAATIIEADKTGGIGEFTLGTDGAGFRNLIVENGGCRRPLDPNPKENEQLSGSIFTQNHLYMNGPEVFNFSLERLPPVVEKALEANATCMDDVDFVIFHQANKNMLRYLRDKMNIPREKFYINVLNIGNTVSATIPIALKECLDEGKIKSGDKILLVGFGVGYSWGATVVTLP